MPFIKSILSLPIAYVLAFSQMVFAESGEDDVYRLMPGDMLEISVWKETDLQKEVRIRPDGKISFPLVGHIQAAGNTPEQLETVIQQKLNKFIPDVVVNLILMTSSGNVIYVIGKVNKPGVHAATSKLDVTQALTMAGGLNPFAAANDIKILRRSEGQQHVMKYRYSDIEKGQNLEQNIVLQGGDVIIVP
jgi:polysaccharide export outer membrane protein